jgi:hypothetical protein
MEKMIWKIGCRKDADPSCPLVSCFFEGKREKERRDRFFMRCSKDGQIECVLLLVTRLEKRESKRGWKEMRPFFPFSS